MGIKEILAKAAAKDKEPEPEMVEVTRFVGQDGKDYWAKSAKTEHCMKYPFQTKLVVKGSKEDK